MTVEKMCLKCGAAPRMWKKDGSGQLTMCETCQREYWREGHRRKVSAAPREKRAAVEETYRTCNTCGQTKAIDQFAINTGTARRRKCRVCYSQENIEKRRAAKGKPSVKKAKSVKAAKPVTPIVSVTAPKLVLIDRVQRRVVMCVVENTQSLPEDVRVGSLARELVQSGYRVMVAGEMAESVELPEAGD